MSLDLSTVNGDPAFRIGLCFLDPIEEVLKEIGPNSVYMLGADAHTSIVHKVMIITGTTDRITKIKIELQRIADIEDLFDIKIQPGTVAPDIKSFEELPNYNSLVIEGPIQPNTLIPVFIYIKANADVNKLSQLPVKISYDYI